VLQSYDITTAIVLLIIVGWVAFSLRGFAIALIVAIALVAAVVNLVRVYRVLDARLAEWATVPALRIQLRESCSCLHLRWCFQILVYSGLFGPMQAVRLFHDAIDQRWFVSFLALGYPLFMLFNIAGIVLTRWHIRRLEALERTQPVAKPVGDARVRRLRMIAHGLTLAYYVLCVAIGLFIWLRLPPVAAAAGVIALVLRRSSGRSNAPSRRVLANGRPFRRNSR